MLKICPKGKKMAFKLNDQHGTSSLKNNFNVLATGFIEVFLVQTTD
jgi:hypothetical protein